MQIAILLYEKLAAQDAVGPYEVLRCVPGWEVHLVGGRFVEDGKTITAAGVTAGIDMALHLVGREAGPEVAQAVQLGIEYDPDPPFDAGSPEKAPAEIVELVKSVSRAGAS